MTCRAQHLGGFLEGQGHSMTLLQKRVRPLIMLFEVGFYNFSTEIIINGRKQEVFEGPVGDYCIARNTMKCLFIMLSN